MWVIGLVVGAWIGSTFGGFGSILGGAVGCILGLVLGKSSEAQKNIEQRLARTEKTLLHLNARLDILEQTRQGKAAPDAEPASDPPQMADTAEPVPQGIDEYEQPVFVMVQSDSPWSHTIAPQPQRASGANTLAQQRDAPSATEQAITGSSFDWLTSSPLWIKLFGGNILAKIGVVLLFFGVASGLKLAADYGFFPVPVRLLLGAVASIAMIMFGWSRSSGGNHRMFGLALQGGGFAILYLIVYFMLVRYQMIGYELAFILFTLLGVGCLLLAASLDSVSLAVLGISGAFLSPVLAGNDSGNHIVLFSYFALLNSLVIAVNWFKSWRQLNIAGFLFTFVIGLTWAFKSYRDEYMFSTELFLILFFLMYSLVPVVFTLYGRAGKPGWGDGLLLFGTPLLGVFFQQPLMHPYRYGMAWSVFVAGLYYLLLWWVLYRKRDEALRLMERGHLGIAVAMFTYAIPLAFGAQVTSAFWTVEGCAVLWLGIRQDRHLARLTGIALQGLAGFYFLAHFSELARATPVFNDVYVGCFIIAMAGIASGLMLHLWEKKQAGSQQLANLLLYWGLLWWAAASCSEIDKFVHHSYQHAAWLGYFATLAALFELAGERWSWTAMRATSLIHFGAIALIAAVSIMRHEHVLHGALTLVFPAAIAVHYWALSRQERQQLALAIGLRHLLILWLLVGVCAAELVWVADTLAPGVALWPMLAWGVTLAAAIHLLRAACRFKLWPATSTAADYAVTGTQPIIIASMIWLALACLRYSGDGSGLPYIPVLNPLDLCILFALHAILKWAGDQGVAESPRSMSKEIKIATYLGAFLWETTLAARLAHHWGGVPFEHEALMHSYLMHAILSVIWTITSVSLMIHATRQGERTVWFIGFALLAAAGLKLMMIDLANKGTVIWTASLIGIALLVIAASYFSPAPPKKQLDTSGEKT